MKIQRFNKFILEAQEEVEGENVNPTDVVSGQFTQVTNDTPENYINMLLIKLKGKIERMFSSYEDSGDENMDVRKAKNLNKEKSTFKEFNLRLDSCEVSKASQLNDNLTVKFSDDENTYNLLISVNTKFALPTDNTKDFTINDIKQCYIKFKKYDLDTFEVIGQITKNTDPNKIDEDFIINLKIELDDMFGDEEDFKIETK
jgi:hypothetical protein